VLGGVSVGRRSGDVSVAPPGRGLEQSLELTAAVVDESEEVGDSGVLDEGVSRVVAGSGDADPVELAGGEGAGGVGEACPGVEEDAAGLQASPRVRDRPGQLGGEGYAGIRRVGESGELRLHDDGLAVDETVEVGLVPEVEGGGVARVEVEWGFPGAGVKAAEGGGLADGCGEGVGAEDLAVHEGVGGGAVAADSVEGEGVVWNGLHLHNTCGRGIPHLIESYATTMVW